MKVTVHHVRLGPEEYRVVRAPVGRALLTDRDRWFQLDVDAGAARAIGVLWLLAARSPRSLVYLPLRDGTGLDLVLLHHSRPFRPHHWKRLRARLGDGAASTVRVPRDDRAADPAARDLFHQHLHAETLFMVGSAPVFRATAGRFFDVAEQGPLADGHYCAEFHRHDRVLGDAREIHVEYRR